MSAIVNDRQNSLDGLDELLSPTLSPVAQINLAPGDSGSRGDSKSPEKPSAFDEGFEMNDDDEGFETNHDGESNERNDEDETGDDEVHFFDEE